MKKLFVLLFSILLLSPLQRLKADEGMWFLMFIGKNMKDMQKEGLRLTAEDIYSVNHSSLKDAVVQFDNGCTAEIVSGNGLVLTNHHCGYGAIAELSTPENDYLTNGFWASSTKEELSPKSLSVRFFVRMDKVTDRILAQVNDKMSEEDREKAINREIAKIEQENSEGGKYVVSVRPFFAGNEYYYFVYQDYNDVRLVGTPPNSIGKFGGNTDNWEWPRHTGDFSMFRIYTDKNGNPATYSPENVPMKPKQHLAISLKGYKEGDFAMILGYPGRTNRWMPAGGVQQNIAYSYPAWVESSRTGMDVLEKYMEKDQKIKLDYASKYAGIANYWKNRAGMIVALKQHKTVETKQKTEKKFDAWANQPAHKAKYGAVVSNLNNYYAATNEKSKAQNYLIGMLRSADFVVNPYAIGTALVQYANENEAKRKEMRPKLEAGINSIFESVSLPLEQEVFAKQLNLYNAKASKEYVAPLVKEIANQNNGSFDKYIADAFQKSIFTKKDELLKYLDTPNAELVQKDPLFLLSSDLMTQYRLVTPNDQQANDTYQKSFRLLVEGLRESKLSPIEYPDANSTMRLTYGTIKTLPLGKGKVNDAEHNYYTTLKGVIAKTKPGDPEFDNPQKLIDLYKEKDYGMYAAKNGELWVNFLSDLDITGGNSGSPVLNGNGELIGLAFDGNLEAMAGDVIFDPKLQRTISVDIRYVLFTIDKFANAKNIIEELTLVKDPVPVTNK